MREYTKNVKRQIRELAGLLYERELNEELSKLETHFEAWRNGKLSPFDLCEKIHHFHQHPARELFNRFNDNPMMDLVVAHAIAFGKLKPAEVSAEVAEALAMLVAFAKTQMNDV